jgi:DNA-binding transcriptional LysR family regulator
VPSDASQVRIVIDEMSFDFRGLDSDQLDLFLGQFNDALHDLRRDRLEAWKPPLFAATSCLDERDLYDYLVTTADRDVMRRFFSLIDKCPEWDAGYPHCDEVEIAGKARQSAWSVSFAVTAVISGHGVACLVFPESAHRGSLAVIASIGQCNIFFFARASEIANFWRGLYELENIPEGAFFELAGRAFPSLIFHSDLTFRRFQGSYQDRRNAVV